MVKYSAKKRAGSKKQSFKKRKYNKKKGGSDGDDDGKKASDTAAPADAIDSTTNAENTTVTNAENTTATNAENTTGAAVGAAAAKGDDSEIDLKKFYDDLIKRILKEINNICKEETEEKRREMLENAIMGKTE